MAAWVIEGGKRGRTWRCGKEKTWRKEGKEKGRRLVNGEARGGGLKRRGW